MSTIGLYALLIGFAACAVSVLGLLLGWILHKHDISEMLNFAGRVATIVSFAALTVACGVLVWCFFVGDYNIQYVLDQHTNSSSTLFKLAGLWAGREGSLLFWAWLISLFNTIMSCCRLNALEPLDNMAVFVGQLVLTAFVGVMLFSEANMPFIVTDDAYYSDDGTLTAAATMTGMNALLQHWAMAIHPPTLFVGYAGLTVPFAYAISAVIVNDSNKTWVLRVERFALVSWLFLTVGIGLGAVWAYVVLGWGGYWGWDPVENASLLPWLVCVALIHSFSMYKARGTFKRWTVMCACLAFAFVIVGTFISRSGLVQSVHAFEGDPVSLVLFGALIVVSILAGIVGCLVRRKSFGPDSDEGAESMLSKDGAHYLNNLLMVVLAVLLAYLTISQALPSFLPFGGASVSSGTYNAIARPIGVIYLLLMAACPLLAWGKTNPKTFIKKARVPFVCALVLFALLMVYFVLYLLPAYKGIVAAGDSNAEAVLEQGPSAYYNGLAIVAFLVAALLLFNSLFQLARVARTGKVLHKGKLSLIGSCIGHAAMAVILVGIVGSSMYVTEVSGYVDYDSDANTCSETFQIKDYELKFTDSSADYADNGMDVVYTTEFDVYKGGKKVGHVSPSVTLVATTQQQQLNANVIHFAGEDLFVVYQGVNEDGDALSMDVRVNPLVSLVWVGFGLLAFGIFLGCLGRRRKIEKDITSVPLSQRAAFVEAKEQA